MISKYVRSIVRDKEILHQVSYRVDTSDDVLMRDLRNDLLYMFNKYRGKMQGLAAIQCGRPSRAILLRFDKNKSPVVVFNPEILFQFGSVNSNEGCMSEGDIRYIVKRPIFTRVRYFDGLNYVTKFYGYRKSRVFAHECDHLDGILLQDKGKPVKEY